MALGAHMYPYSYMYCAPHRDGVLHKFPDKKKVMVIDEDPVPPVASINITSFDLRALIESKKARKISLIKAWVPKCDGPRHHTRPDLEAKPGSRDSVLTLFFF